MVSHADRLAAARDAIQYICSRNAAEMATLVPNCPGWTVYNAAVHIGRVGVAWHSMIQASPDDPDSRMRGYADAESRGSDIAPDVLATWAHEAVHALVGDVDRPCYFSMTGGHGTVGLWGWHAASELGVHRLDVEAALGVPHAMSHRLVLDAIEYTAQYFLPAMVRATGSTPGVLQTALLVDGTPLTAAMIGGSAAGPVDATITGAPIDVLLALWGRPHGSLVVQGSHEVFEQWHALPGTAFQFGTWD